MTTTFRLDPLTGDLAREGGRASTASEAEELAQRITTSLRLHRGEDRYDQDNGFPWTEEVFSKRVPPRAIQERIRAYVAKVPGVVTVDTVSIQINATSRLMSVFLSVNRGTVQVQVQGVTV